MTVTAIVKPAPFVPLGPAYQATSASVQNIVGAGVLAFQVAAGLAYSAGMRLRVASRSSGNWMEGVVRSYEATTVQIEMNLAKGTGQYNDWNLNLAGEPGIAPSYAGAVTNALLQAWPSPDTFNLRTLAGAAPSDLDIVRALFPNGVLRLISSPVGLTVPAGVTFGTVANTPFRLWFLLIDNGGTIVLGIMQTRVAADNSILPFPANGYILPSLIGAGTAAGQIYVGTTVTINTPRPFLVLACAEYDGGLATPGTFNVAPSRVTMFGVGLKLPGQPLQSGIVYPAFAATNTVIPLADTIPQITQGAEFTALAVAPRSAMSVFELETQVMVGIQEADVGAIIAVFRDPIANALAATWQNAAFSEARLWTKAFAGSLAVQTFRGRIGKTQASTGKYIAVNGYGEPGSTLSRYLGGAANSFLSVVERQT